ncbi:MAG TPA: antitoxin VbhA family protein [Terracidiphilus sp.]|nr:antitoxin VbhA family protein [Terracidiphilus sp.]
MAPKNRGGDGGSDRAAAVESVLGSFRMEGLEPDAETATLLAAYASGSLTLDEFGAAIERHVAKLGSAFTADGAA